MNEDAREVFRRNANMFNEYARNNSAEATAWNLDEKLAIEIDREKTWDT